MYNTDITNKELQHFHKKIKVTDICTTEENDAFHQDGDKYYPLFYFDKIVDATKDMKILGDGKCIINPDPYIHFESDPVYAKRLRTEENPLLKAIGDSLTEAEFNYLIYYLRTFHPFRDEIRLNKNDVKGSYGDYVFDWNSVTLLDEGVLITEDDSTLGTVTLNTPVFTNSTYILHLTVRDYEKTNIQTGDDEPIIISTIDVELEHGVPVDIDFADVEVNTIVDFDAWIEIKHDKPYVKATDYILFNANKSVYYLDEYITLTASYFDGYNVPVEDVEITFKQGGTTIGTATTDSEGIATYQVEATTVGTFSFTAVADTISSETVSAQVKNPVKSVTLAPDRIIALKNATIELTAHVVGDDDNVLVGKTVTFKRGSTVIGTANTDVEGNARVQYKTTSTGTANFTATIKGVVSDAVSIKTKTNNTVLHVYTSASPNPASVNQDVTVTVTVTDLDDEPVPQEPVKNGSGTVLGKTDAYGVFKQIRQFSTPGQYPLQFKAGTHNGGLTVSVGEEPPTPVVTSVGLISDKASVTLGGTVDFTATVLDQNGNGMESETVTFKRGSSTLGTATTNSSGVATYTYTTDVAGSLSFTAECDSVVSSSVSVTVNKISSSVTIVSDKASAVIGETFTVSGALTANSEGLVGASVKLYDGASLVDTLTTSSGGAYSKTITASSGNVGSHSYSVVFEGDPVYDSVTSSTVSVTITKKQTALTLSTDKASVGVGEQFTLSGTLTSGGTGLHNVYVKLYDGNSLVDAIATDDGDFEQNITFDNTGLGTHTYHVEYEGDSEYATSTSSNVSVVCSSTPVPVPDSVSLVGSKSILSYADSESCTLTATVLDDNSQPVEGETVTFSIVGGSTIGTDTTDSNGEATVSYSSEGSGDLSIQASVGMIVSETYGIEDCTYYDTTLYSTSSKTFNIALPTHFTLEYVIKQTNSSYSVPYLDIGDSTNNRVLVGQYARAGANGIIVYKSGQTNHPYSTNPTFNTENTVWFKYDGTKYYYKLNNGVVMEVADANVTLTKLIHSESGDGGYLKNIKIKPL